MEVDQRDRERGWSKLFIRVEEQVRQELQAKGIRDGAECLQWLDNELPRLQDASDFRVEASQLDPQFRLLMSLDDNESISLVFPAVTEISADAAKPPLKINGMVWFTSQRFMAVRSDAAGLLFYAIALNTLNLGVTEKGHMKETVQAWLRSILQGKVSRDNLVQPFAYGAASDLKVSGLGSPNSICSAEFKTASSSSQAVKITFGRPVIPERVWLANSYERGPTPVIFCKPYPCKAEIQDVLLQGQHAKRDSEGRVVFSSAVQTKLFVDALRREKQLPTRNL